jgi:TetR/AcrR family fatty acid metabolism transcriptional regulator
MARNSDKKPQIIDAAIKVFAKKGFYNSKVADVAKAAGIADGTIYLYFKNKDDLLISLFETKVDELLETFKNALSVFKSAKDKLNAFIRLYFQLMEEQQDLAEVLQVELRQSSKFIKDYHPQKFFDFLNIIGDIIKEGQQSGEFDSTLSVNTTKLAIFGSIDELARQWILSFEHKFDLKQTASNVASIFIKGMMPVI